MMRHNKGRMYLAPACLPHRPPLERRRQLRQRAQVAVPAARPPLGLIPGGVDGGDGGHGGDRSDREDDRVRRLLFFLRARGGGATIPGEDAGRGWGEGRGTG